MRKTDKKALSFSVSFIHSALSGVTLDANTIDILLRECRIPKPLLQVSDARVTLEQLARFTSLLILASGDELLGRAREPLPVGSRSLLMHWLVTAKTMEQVLERLAGFFQIVDKGVSFQIEIEEELIHLVVLSHDDTDGFGGDLFFVTHRILSWLSREIIAISHLEFEYPKPAIARDFRAVYYGASMSFDCDRSRMSLPRSLLQKPVRQDQAGLELLLKDPYFALFLLDFKTDSWAAKVAGEINDKLDALPTLPELAAIMKVKPYTLQRRLADEGTTYLTIKNHLKRDSAIELLINTDLTMEEISVRLGFSETSSFTRTFKQWIGVPPTAYRKNQR
ncbi:AraC family transcriptional regulator [Pseudomaricurvus alkylphenolicus]|jgi:AraC-like DNA-binding protein|uniref:AraC family transcriptional regulator n=1 Tax=Pseudomaricurvus alkylphenolicus TaxID=1306991 RepID=UPI001422B214|nr:AraC family transcriptional regulator [Pseudomaricurvus alkylphenolicus]NIB42540.1 AraC family transcriptional regulator [Pseudomaricurvus alkylphenolicus]